MSLTLCECSMSHRHPHPSCTGACTYLMCHSYILDYVHVQMYIRICIWLVRLCVITLSVFVLFYFILIWWLCVYFIFILAILSNKRKIKYLDSLLLCTKIVRMSTNEIEFIKLNMHGWMHINQIQRWLNLNIDFSF